MEAWEEDSLVESCRSSVISDLDELEANLYGFVHHERNEIADENYLNECCVLPLEEGIRNSPEIFRDITEQNISIGEDVKISEEERKNHELECDDSKYHKANSDRPKDCGQELSNEFADSRYNVTNANNSLNEGVVPVSVTLTPDDVPGSTITQNLKCNIPPVIDVLSSSDEDANIGIINNVSSEKIQSIEEVVVLDDSDSDIIIELEKVNIKRKKRKRKRDPEIPADIKLNTAKAIEIAYLDEDYVAHFPEFENVQSMSTNQQEDTSMPEKQAGHRGSICKNWTPQMVQFYEESWGGEYMNLSEIQRSMSDKGWDLDVSDEFCALPGRVQDRRYFANKSRGWCTNCNRKGHYRNECTEKFHIPNCYRCGSSTHPESRCQSRICLTCGEKSNVLITACRPCRMEKEKGRTCSICSQLGHPPNCCPDLWRRFHATVAPGKIVHPKKVLYKEKKNMYCCNCATKGHHAYQCKKNTYNDYVPLTPRVVSYKKPSLPKRTDISATQSFSENWEQVGRIAPKYRVEPPPQKKQPRNEKRGTKRAGTPVQHGKAKVVKLSKSDPKAPNKETSNSTLGIPAKIDLPKAKKRQKQSNKPKKTKMKEPNSQPQADLGVGNALSSEQNGVESHVKSGKPSASGESNVENLTVDEEQFPQKRKASDRKVTLTKRQYKMLTTKQGEEVLKHVTREVHGSAVTLIHGKENVLMFIGTKKSTLRAKKLLLRIICSKEIWNGFAGSSSVTENGALSETANCTKKSKNKVISTSNKREDLRVEIKNNASNGDRNVRYLTKIGPHEHTLTSSSIREPNKDDYFVNKKIAKIQSYAVKDGKKAKANIQRTAKAFLSEKEISLEKLQIFAKWALSMYGTFVNGFIKYNLKVLSTVTQNGKPVEFFRKHLLVIANWRCRPVVGKL